MNEHTPDRTQSLDEPAPRSFASGLNFRTTSCPSRSSDSSPILSASSRIEAYSARFSTEAGGGP